MFSLFGGDAKTATVVDPRVGAQLRPEKGFPALIAPDGRDIERQCIKVAVTGVPPNASFRDGSPSAEASIGYVVPAMAGKAPVALINIAGAHPRFEIWDLTSDKPPAFAHKRTVELDRGQSAWQGFLALGVACLPGDSLLLPTATYAPQIKERLYLYDLAARSFSDLGSIAPDTADYDKYYEIRGAGNDANIVLYFSGRTRTAPEVYYNAYNHLLLVSQRFPHGLEILKLEIQDGNIVRWAVNERTLWLQTLDGRNSVERFWSLDLTKVL